MIIPLRGRRISIIHQSSEDKLKSREHDGREGDANIASLRLRIGGTGRDALYASPAERSVLAPLL